ncbi:MAG: MFS transporter, partial [Roseomonas sp.]|nr:MFS transporter [Roseomonas sp.]
MAMERDLGLPAGASFLIVAIQLGLAGVLAPRVGRLIDRRGPRAVMVAGSIFYAAGLALLAAAPGALTALLACLVLGIAAAMTLSEASNAALATLGADGARRRIAALAAISGLAAAVAWPSLAWAEAQWGWRI